MRALAATAAVLLLASCFDPAGQCKTDADCLSDQVCGADALCVPGARPLPGEAPVALADAYAFSGAGPFAKAEAEGVLRNDTDPDGATLTAELVESPTYGQIYLAPDGSFTYAPIVGFNGTDVFTYRATNGARASEVASVTLQVAGPPAARADAYAWNGAGPWAVAAGTGVLANDTDPNAAALSAELVSDATSGHVVLAADGSFTYTPGAGFSGTDRFTYRAKTATLASDAALVTIAVAPPVSATDAYTVAAGGALVVAAATGVLANDSDPGGAPLAAVLVAGPTGGALALAPDGSFTYTPNPGFTGADGFTYRATNGTLSSAAASASITVGP